MKIEFREYNENNSLYLKKMMIDAYDDDALLHTGGEYFSDEADDFFQKLLQESYQFKVIYDCEKDKIIGACALDLINNEIISFFIDPLLHNFGYGRYVMDTIINEYNKEFTVSIPSYSKKLYHFFSKCGFKVIRENYYEDYVIMKIMK